MQETKLYFPSGATITFKNITGDKQEKYKSSNLEYIIIESEHDKVKVESVHTGNNQTNS